MTGLRSRCEPLPISQFPLGKGPFRARGLAYLGALKYVESRVRGGRKALLDALGARDPYAPYYDQIFLAGSDYDVSPLARLYVAVSEIEGVATTRLIEDLSRRSAPMDAKGIWKPLLKAASPEQMADRLHFAFNRYFPPCHAQPVSIDAQRFHFELSKLPICMVGLYTASTVGFVVGALQFAGATGVHVEAGKPSSDGDYLGVSIARVRFTASWSRVDPSATGS